MKIIFTGEWSEEDKRIVLADTAALREQYPYGTVECQCRISRHVVPFRAIINQPGRSLRPVAYSAEALAENINNCY